MIMKINVSKFITKEHLIVTAYLYTMILFSMGSWFLIDLTGLREELSDDMIIRISVVLGIIMPIAIYAIQFDKNEAVNFFLKSGRIVISKTTKKEFIQHFSVLCFFMAVYIMSHHYIIGILQKLFEIEMFSEKYPDIFVWPSIMVAPIVYFSLYSLKLKK